MNDSKLCRLRKEDIVLQVDMLVEVVHIGCKIRSTAFPDS